MADLSLTAANVVAVSGTGLVTETCVWGGTVTAGMLVYKVAATGRLAPADAATPAPVCTIYGMALDGGANGQPGIVMRAGNVNPGATLVVGQLYVLSTTAGGGKIAPVTDLAAGWYTAVVGIATTASNLLLGFTSGNTARA